MNRDAAEPRILSQHAKKNDERKKSTYTRTHEL